MQGRDALGRVLCSKQKDTSNLLREGEGAAGRDAPLNSVTNEEVCGKRGKWMTCSRAQLCPRCARAPNPKQSTLCTHPCLAPCRLSDPPDYGELLRVNITVSPDNAPVLVNPTEMSFAGFDWNLPQELQVRTGAVGACAGGTVQERLLGCGAAGPGGRAMCHRFTGSHVCSRFSCVDVDIDAWLQTLDCRCALGWHDHFI